MEIVSLREQAVRGGSPWQLILPEEVDPANVSIHPCEVGVSRQSINAFVRKVQKEGGQALITGRDQAVLFCYEDESANTAIGYILRRGDWPRSLMLLGRNRDGGSAIKIFPVLI